MDPDTLSKHEFSMGKIKPDSFEKLDCSKYQNPFYLLSKSTCFGWGKKLGLSLISFP